MATPVPDGIEPLFLTLASQKVFGLKPGENLTPEIPYKKISRDQIVQDIEVRGVVSDFHPLKDAIDVSTRFACDVLTRSIGETLHHVDI